MGWDRPRVAAQPARPAPRELTRVNAGSRGRDEAGTGHRRLSDLLIGGTEVTIERNPAFHEWSRAARPDGYPDEVVWTIGPDVAAQLDMVQSGAADLTFDRPDSTRITQIRAQEPAQVHTSVLGTVFFFMNTTVPPFDDVRVRRAVNLAIDRSKVVELMGGPLREQVTCQFIPPNAPGYAPYCPYTVKPNPAGTWTAPDLAAARDLIAASGKVGTKISIPAFARFVDASAYIVSVLNDLGFDASQHEAADPTALFQELYDPDKGHLVPAGLLFWAADYPAPSSIMLPTFRCGDPGNFSRFCDPSTDALIKSALELKQTDHALVDLAPVASVANDVWVDFVSARVGNYQHHPEWGVLFDQLWVQ